MNENGAPFEVSFSAKVAQQIKACAKVAAGMGKRALFVSSMEAIHHRLRHDPLVFGERRFGLTTLKLSCHIGALRPVAVHYAVHEELRLVFLVKAILMGA